MMRWRRLATAASLIALGLGLTGNRGPTTQVDLELVLAVDTSASVDSWEYRLQMEGLIRAFRDPVVVAAIRGTGPGGIAVTLVHWSSAHEQRQIVPWMQITDAASADRFAAAIAANRGRSFSDSTGIGEAIRYGERLIRRNRFEGRRKSIDVSGDGSNNSGTPPLYVRELVVAEGVTINGLTILDQEPFLYDYYIRNVIGGAGAFVMTVESYHDIINGMRAKLLREISVSVAENEESETGALVRAVR
ncbi:MAG: DUF1194 domain-containing protein [Hyphomicrobiales bacterium]|nr:DUF1194 domain-containing protein [Hyphomicrobiales bacterium]